MHLTILDRGSKEFDDSILWIKVPVGSSSISIYPGHVDLISTVSHGQVIVAKSDGDSINFIIKSGYLYVRENTIHLLVCG